MARVVFYQKPGCRTNARQRALLLAAGHDVDARDLLAEPWTAERLRSFFAGLAVEEWFNRAAPRVKSGEIQPASIDAGTALALMLANPLLIRRPLLEVDGKRCAGFEADRLAREFGISLADASEGCAHPPPGSPNST